MCGPAGPISRFCEPEVGTSSTPPWSIAFFETTPNIHRLAVGCWESPRYWASRSRCSGRGRTRLANTCSPAGWRRRSAFAALVGLIVFEGGRRWGRVSGVSAGFALLVMPRVFAHAHLAALDTFLSLFWTLALLVGERSVRSRRPFVRDGWCRSRVGPRTFDQDPRLVLVAGLGCLGFRLATASACVGGHGRLGGCRHQLVLVGLALALARFLVEVQRFLGDWRDTGNPHGQYFGRVIADREVPWHYPWFYFAVTVPVGLLALGALGIARGWITRRLDPFPLLLAATIVVFLGLFSTRVPVYDGERLFLNVFPAWALLIGFGFGWLWDHGLSTFRRRIALGAFLLAQSFGLVALHPFGLSYYNGLVGGLPGAEWLGLELTYWNDPVDQVLLDRLAREAQPGASAALVPTLYRDRGS